MSINFCFKQVTFRLKESGFIFVFTFTIIKGWININTTCQHKSITLIYVFGIVFLKRKLYQLKIIGQVLRGEPIPVILKISPRITDADFLLHEATGLYYTNF